jgi:hypothetical protein
MSQNDKAKPEHLATARGAIREFQRGFDDKPKELRTAERGEQEFLSLAGVAATKEHQDVVCELLRLRLVQRKLAIEYDWRLANAIIKDGKINIQAGAGVVADSVPKYEWKETLNKARAMVVAVEMASTGLGFGTASSPRLSAKSDASKASVKN